jgi:hypothetical protein
VARVPQNTRLVLIATAATCLVCIPDAAQAMSLVGPPAAKVEPVSPPVQRPQEPIVPVQADTDKMDYRRGWQYILSGHRENYFISGVSSS